MDMVKLEVNGVAVEVPKGSNLLVAARAANIKIPTLCDHPDLKPGASCGICVVRQLVPSRTEPGKFVPSPKLLRACCTEATPGMKIRGLRQAQAPLTKKLRSLRSLEGPKS